MAVFTNLFTNPQPATGTQWSQAYGTTGTGASTLISDAAGPAGNLGRRLTWSAANTVVGGGQAWSIGTNTAATAGTLYSIGVYLRCSKAQTIEPRIQWVDSGSTVLSTDIGPAVTLTANTWTAVKWEGALSPASTAFMRCQAYATNVASVLWAIGDTLDAQAGTIAQSATLPQPFHGAMADDVTHDYAWTGTADASTSTLTIPDPPGLAAPTGLAATPISSSQINVSWNHPASGATGYQYQVLTIQTGDDPAAIDWTNVPITTTPPPPLSDSGLAANQRRAYRVRSTN